MGRTRIFLPAEEYDLESTLTSGQSFRWRRSGAGWEGVVGSRWVHLSQAVDGIEAAAARPVSDWVWLTDYLQSELDLATVKASLPMDEPMRTAVAASPGLRLLRQDPWECLASFILSSTKQIVQIRQVIELLCERWGERIAVPGGHRGWRAFPAADTLAGASEADLRACKTGFRAAYLREAAAAVRPGAGICLESLRRRPLEEAREALLSLPGVGPKIADCVLLFSLGFPVAFPMDVWILRGLRELYFPGREVPPRELAAFAASHFGPHAGHAQQFLFHYLRVQRRRPAGGVLDGERKTKA